MKKYAVWVILFFVVALLGFMIVSTTFEPLDSLMRPPKVEGENLSIQLAFEENVGTDYILKQPIGGNYRSAYTFIDLTDDKNDEVIVFYSRTDDLGIVRMNVLDNVDGNWKSIADFQSVHNDIQEVDFADFNGDGRKEIIVGWTAFQDSFAKLIKIYEISVDSDTVNIEPIFSDYYSIFKIADIDCDGDDDILNLKYTTAGNSAEYAAYLLSYGKNGISEKGGFILDKSVSSVAAVNFDHLKDENIRRIYIDGYKIDSGMTTDCFFWDTAEKNFVRYDVMDLSVSALSSRTAAVFCSDINSDGIIEVPTEEFLPNISDNTSDTAGAMRSNMLGHSLIKWVQIKDDIAETVERHIILSQYGYSFRFSEDWLGKVSVDNNPQKGVLTFWSLKSVDGYIVKDKQLFSVMTLTDIDLEAIGEISFYYSLLSHVKGKYYYCRIYDAGEDFGITKKEIKQRIIAG